jgi:hypothetical protein
MIGTRLTGVLWLIIGAVGASEPCAHQNGTVNIDGYCTCNQPMRPLAESVGGNAVKVWCLEQCPTNGETSTRTGCLCTYPDYDQNCTEQVSGQPSAEDICSCKQRSWCPIGTDVELNSCRCPAGSRQRNNYSNLLQRCRPDDDESSTAPETSIPATSSTTHTSVINMYSLLAGPFLLHAMMPA